MDRTQIIAALEGGEVGREVDRAVNVLLNGACEIHHVNEDGIVNGRSLDRVSISLDACIALVERVRPDTETHRYSCTVWTGKNPQARIFYEVRDEDAEGGWAIGALNPLAVRAPTPAAALLAALLKATEDSP